MRSFREFDLTGCPPTGIFQINFHGSRGIYGASFGGRILFSPARPRLSDGVQMNTTRHIAALLEPFGNSERELAERLVSLDARLIAELICIADLQEKKTLRIELFENEIRAWLRDRTQGTHYHAAFHLHFKALPADDQRRAHALEDST